MPQAFQKIREQLQAGNPARIAFLALSLLFGLWFFPWISHLPLAPLPAPPAAPEAEEEAFPPDPKTQFIVIDAGHGGEDPGCMAGGVEEKQLTLALAELLETELEARGYRVLLTRRGDFLLPVGERAAAGNQRHIFLLLSLHINFLQEAPGADGIENWFNSQVNPQSETLAQLIQDEVCEATGARNRGLRPEGQFRVTRRAKVPSCLLECGFLSNRRERERLISKEYQQLLVTGIANGIDRFYDSVLEDFT